MTSQGNGIQAQGDCVGLEVVEVEVDALGAEINTGMDSISA